MAAFLHFNTKFSLDATTAQLWKFIKYSQKFAKKRIEEKPYSTCPLTYVSFGWIIKANQKPDFDHKTYVFHERYLSLKDLDFVAFMNIL